MNFLVEHILGVAVWAYLPIAGDVASELAAREHSTHVCHVGYIPSTDVSIEMASFKHPAHVCHVGYIPSTDVAIKRIAYVFVITLHIVFIIKILISIIPTNAFKHATHVGYVGYVPSTDVTIEFAAFKHMTHVCHFGHIPPLACRGET